MITLVNQIIVVRDHMNYGRVELMNEKEEIKEILEDTEGHSGAVDTLNWLHNTVQTIINRGTDGRIYSNIGVIFEYE